MSHAPQVVAIAALACMLLVIGALGAVFEAIV
jgi:hypothetical protein